VTKIIGIDPGVDNSSFVIFDTETETYEVPYDGGDNNDDLTHIALHCDPDRALCGTSLKGCPWVNEDFEPEKDCVVCMELEKLPCENCGAD